MHSTNKPHLIGLASLLVPGLASCTFALVADFFRVGDFISGWGPGQTIFLLLGTVMAVMGFMIHREALAVERGNGRRYSRTVTFILTFLLLLVGTPLAIAEVVARILPESFDRGGSYRQTDAVFGFSLAPDCSYHVISRPKDFDIHVRIGPNGFRRCGDDAAVELASANVVIVGDSHPFGVGVAEDMTLAAHLSSSLHAENLSSNVINAGVPGFGLGQSLLRIRSFKTLKPGTVIVIFINPINDLVNLSSAVDYCYPKPHAVLDGGKLVFRSAPSDWGYGAFLFSEPFDSLNDVFQIADRRKWYHCALLRRFSNAAVEPPTIDGVTMLVDNSSTEQFLAYLDKRISDYWLLFASRFWPEMPKFTDERKELAALTTAVVREMQNEANTRQCHLLAVVAQEAYSHQGYSKNVLAKVQSVVPDSPIQLGWSRQAILGALRESSVVTVTLEYGGLDVESLFVQNDDHTSGLGHKLIATHVAQEVLRQGWIVAPSRR